MTRAAVVLVDGDRVALIERVRDGRRYYLFPGGGVDPGERPEDAARREAREELGLEVEIVRLIARTTFDGNEQLYYLARTNGGTFGRGEGEEMTGEAFPEFGAYRAVRVPIDDLATLDVRPSDLVRILRRSVTNGWPEEVAELSS